MTADAGTDRSRSLEWLRSSAVPYLAVVVLATVLARYMPYLVREDIRIKGQPLQIAVELILFPLALGLWVVFRGSRTCSRWLAVFLWAMVAAWAVRMSLMLVHGDQFNHLVWLTPVFLLMLLLKTPTWQDAWRAVEVLAWALAAMLILSLVLEVTNVMEPMYLPPEITEFQQREYWLPLDGFLGVDGRWTGPFGHNTRTGFAAAMIFVVALGRLRRATVPLALIGVFFLLITSVRASYLAALTGILILVLFSHRGRLARIPGWVRWALLGGAAILGALGFTLTGAGLTGRENIWPAFWVLIPQNPVIGVGASGISEAGGLAALRVDAHNILLDELVRFGVVGFVAMIGALAMGTVIAFRAASAGFAAGAAVVTAFLVTSMTDIQNDWLQLYYHNVLIVLAVMAAGQWSEQRSLAREPENSGT